MKRLTAILLLILFCMHYGPSLIAQGYAEQTSAAKAWQYILNGFGVACILCLLGILARSLVLWPTVIWGMGESAEQGICRLGKPIGGLAPSAPPFSGLCGTDFYWLGVIAVFVLAVSMLDKLRNKK